MKDERQKELERLVGEQNRRLRDIEKQLENIENECSTTGQQLIEARKQMEKLNTEHETSRKERQVILANGGDPSKINARLKAIKDELEMVEDKIIGLEGRNEKLKEEEKILVEEQKEVRMNILKVQFKPLIEEYNEQASQLAQVVKKIWDLRDALLEPYTGSSVIFPPAWEESALNKIPKLFLPVQPLSNRDGDNYYFILSHHRYQREKESKGGN